MHGGAGSVLVSAQRISLLSELVEVPDIGPRAPVPIVLRDIAPIIIPKVHDVNRQPNDMWDIMLFDLI